MIDVLEDFFFVRCLPTYYVDLWYVIVEDLREFYTQKILNMNFLLNKLFSCIWMQWKPYTIASSLEERKFLS